MKSNIVFARIYPKLLKCFVFKSIYSMLAFAKITFQKNKNAKKNEDMLTINSLYLKKDKEYYIIVIYKLKLNYQAHLLNVK